MSLSIGELVAGLRADEGQFTRSLSNAELAMRGLTRDVDGRLRDMNGRFVDSSQGMGNSLSYGIGRGARAATEALGKVAPAVLGLGVGVPAVAAVTAALGGLAAGAAAAGLAVMAFKLAAQPQLDAVADSSAAAEAAEKAHEKATLKKAAAQKLAAKGGEEYEKALRESEAATKAAKEADAAYEAQLKALPAPTREYAMALQGLKDDHEKWSESLAGDTMPVFTKGIEVIRALLPQLTPFVKGAAAAFSDFLDGVGRGVKSAGFKEWAADMSAAAGPALRDFLAVIKNLGVGFGGLLQAFLPVSDDMTGGLVGLTEAFAKWATSLKDSEGFAQFLDMASEGGQTLKLLATAALDLFTAFSPMLGITAMLAVKLAELINMVPPDVLTGIAAGFVAIGLAVKAYGLYTTIASAATKIWAGIQLVWNAIMMANPIGLVIAAIVGLVAIIVVAYQKSETFRNIVQSVWAAVKAAISASVEGIKAAISWFGELPGRIGGWFGRAKDAAVGKFTELVGWIKGLPARASSAMSGLAGALRSRAMDAGRQLVSATRQKISDAISWIRGLPGRARSALGNLGGILWNAGKSIVSGFINGIKSMFSGVRRTLGDLTSKLTSWKGPEDVDKKILTPAGRMVLGSFMRGIDLETPALRAQLQGLTGQVPGMTLGGLGGAAAAGGSAGVRIEIAGPEEMTRLIRGIVRTKGGGSVQVAFGRGRG
ncbi:phage tail protein [Streptomyces chartreusis]|uniref:phage tail protein n=1 Tax=Streptomyces chartreusis TaxID=1969 RepID=UPI003817ADF9